MYTYAHLRTNRRDRRSASTLIERRGETIGGTDGRTSRREKTPRKSDLRRVAVEKQREGEIERRKGEKDTRVVRGERRRAVQRWIQHRGGLCKSCAVLSSRSERFPCYYAIAEKERERERTELVIVRFRVPRRFTEFPPPPSSGRFAVAACVVTVLICSSVPRAFRKLIPGRRPENFRRRS